MKTGKLIVVSAPSGTGKSSICSKLLELHPDWEFSTSVTTRPPRKTETNGEHYIFVSIAKFEHMVKFGDFIESEWVHGNRYGTLIEPLENAIDSNKILLLDIDVKGSLNIMEEFEDTVISIFIQPPGDSLAEMKEILAERLEKRGSDGSTIVKRRLTRVEAELELSEKFSHTVVNEKLDDAINEVNNIILEELNVD